MASHLAFLITIDTEADNEWARGPVATYHSIQILPKFQALCDRYGMKPTYLIACDVASDQPSSEILRGLASTGCCEIGAHLHTWRTPPYVPQMEQDIKRHPYMHEYPLEIQRAKLQHLGETIEREIGVTPTSYRGGRWSLDTVALDLLEELGYVADTTVSPGVSWRHMPGVRAGGSAFMGAPALPYHPSATDVCRCGDRSIVEVPVTIAARGPLGRVLACPFTANFDASGIGHFAMRAAKKLHVAWPCWLHPARCDTADLLAVCASRLSSGVLNMMFHSSELIAGGAPSVPDAAAETQVWERIEKTFAYVTHVGAEGCTLTEFARQLAPQCGSSV